MARNKDKQDNTWDSEDYSYSESDEDDNGRLMGEDVQVEFLKTLNIVTKNSGSTLREMEGPVFDKTVIDEREQVVEEERENRIKDLSESTDKKSITTLTDVLIQTKDEEDEDKEPDQTDLSYVEQQKEVIQAFKASLLDISDDENDFKVLEEAEIPSEKDRDDIIEKAREKALDKFKKNNKDIVDLMGVFGDDSKNLAPDKAFLRDYILLEGWKDDSKLLDWRKQHNALARSKEDLAYPTVLKGKESTNELVEDDKSVITAEEEAFKFDLRHEIDNGGTYAKQYKLLAQTSGRAPKISSKKRKRLAKKEKIAKQKEDLATQIEEEKNAKLEEAKQAIAQYILREQNDTISTDTTTTTTTTATGESAHDHPDTQNDDHMDIIKGDKKLSKKEMKKLLKREKRRSQMEEVMNQDAYAGVEDEIAFAEDDYNNDTSVGTDNNNTATADPNTPTPFNEVNPEDDVDIWKFGPKKVRSLIGTRPKTMPVEQYEKYVSDIVDTHQRMYDRSVDNIGHEKYEYMQVEPIEELKETNTVDLLTSIKSSMKPTVSISLKRALAPFQTLRTKPRQSSYELGREEAAAARDSRPKKKLKTK